MYVNKKPKVESAETKEQTNSTTTATSECRDQLGGRGQGRGRGRSQGHGRGGGRGAYRSAKGRPCQSYRGGGGGQRDNRQKDRACYRCNKVGNLAKDCRVSMLAYDRNDERGRGRGRRGGGAPKRFRQSRDDGMSIVRGTTMVMVAVADTVMIVDAMMMPTTWERTMAAAAADTVITRDGTITSGTQVRTMMATMLTMYVRHLRLRL